MQRFISFMLGAAIWTTPLSVCVGDEGSAAESHSEKFTVHWPQFRGPGARGIAKGKLPAAWNAVKGENTLWKTRIAGLGHASPVIWGDRVYVASAVSGQENPQLKVGLYGNIAPVQDDTKHTWRLYCLDKNTGRVIWDKVVHQGVPRIKRHTKATHANSTPAANEKYVVAFFGAEGLYCYTTEGELHWKKELGALDSGYYKVREAQWGFGSSPIIDEGRVIVQCDVQDDSFLAVFDLKTGDELWRTKRDEVPTWGTPTVHVGEERSQIIVNGYKHIGGYDLATGKPLWWMKGGGDIPVPTPIVAHDLIFITNAHGGEAPVYAVRLDASGDITQPPNQERASESLIAWSAAKVGAYMQTPLAYGDYLYVCRDNGVLTTFKAKTGQQTSRMRLAEGRTGFTASPIAGDGKLYFSSEEGDIYVLRAGPEPHVLSVNPVGEVCMATPAVSEGKIFIRGQDHLFCVGPSKN